MLLQWALIVLNGSHNALKIKHNHDGQRNLLFWKEIYQHNEVTNEEDLYLKSSCNVSEVGDASTNDQNFTCRGITETN